MVSGERGPVTGFYDFYGSTDTDPKHVAELVVGAAGTAFQPRWSDERGDYYLAEDGSGLELTVESNELDDEEGKYLQQPQHPEFPVLLFASHRQPGEHGTSPPLDGLREKLSAVGGLRFLERRRVFR